MITHRRLPIVCAAAGLVLLASSPALAAELPAADRQFVDSTVAQVMQQQRLPG
jgi:DNA-binding IclR family transcriptional regulator